MGDRCIFHPAWSNRCSCTDTTAGLCPEHTGKRCVGCGAVAVRECSHAGQFVCGYPLCPSCHHLYRGGSTESDGHGRGGWRNGKRTEVSND